MLVRKATEHDMYMALAKVNERYAGNVTFKTFEPKGRGFSFTLTVVKSRIDGKPAPGVRNSWNSGRIVRAACWHVHGHFFDALFEQAPEARVWSSFFRRFNQSSDAGWISAAGGNWEDGEIGSMMQPCRFSEACFCNE